ncbi:MAG: hypothetical protein KKH08_01720, partial [Candidatus Omnitrophica bacterium]|nr:hypothetical protein [Candidatus Omnitrophota bacterium]
MKKRTLIAIVLFTSATFFINQIALQAKEAKKVSAVGTKIMVSSDLLPYLGALTFIAPQEAQHPRPKVHGMTKQNELSRIDGHNHDLVGELVSASQQSEGIPGITTNVDKNQLLIQKVAVDGTPVDVQYETDYVDIPALVDYLKDQADITITRDTVYKGGNIGSKEDPKVVIVDAARLKLMHDFEGYGILVLTGERKDNPRWDDELTADDIDSDKSTLYNNLRQIATELELDFPKEQRARRRLRLVMEDTSSWYGMIISDIGAETRAEAVIDREINVPEADSIDIKKGRRTDPSKEKDLRDEWEEEERQSPCRGRESSTKSFRELFAGLFETKLAYAKNNKDDVDDGKVRTRKGKKVKEQKHIVYSKEKIRYRKPVWHRHG